MKSKYTALIVPALTEIAGQCRIVASEGTIRNPLADYRSCPDRWKDVGIMNSRGELVCCEPFGNLVEKLQACEPLMAGLVVAFEQDTPARTDT